MKTHSSQKACSQFYCPMIQQVKCTVQMPEATLLSLYLIVIIVILVIIVIIVMMVMIVIIISQTVSMLSVGAPSK